MNIAAMNDKLLYLYAQYTVSLEPLPKPAADGDRVQTILSVVFTITGALAVLFFALGGLRYITAQGDPQQIAQAKNTLIYAIIGLVISIMAVAIVTFVLGRV